jgi:hypothetical protein
MNKRVILLLTVVGAVLMLAAPEAMAKAKHQSTITVSPKVLDFGSVHVASYGVQFLNITNDGDNPKRVKLTKIEGSRSEGFDDFKPDPRTLPSGLPTTFTLAPHKARDITFVFTPTRWEKGTTNEEKATLVMKVGKAEMTVPLTGTVDCQPSYCS